MAEKHQTRDIPERRILGRVAADEFVGRNDALAKIITHASAGTNVRGMVVLAAPSVGSTELLRQAYDELFHIGGPLVPIYFAVSRNDRSAFNAARHFLHTFLLQLIAYRRREPGLVHEALTLNDLRALAAPGDFDWMERLLETCEREQKNGDERAFIDACLSAPKRASVRGTIVMPMIDGLHVAEHLTGDVSLGTQITKVFMQAETPFVVAGLRRRVLDIVHGANGPFDNGKLLRLDELADADARLMIDKIGARTGLAINEQTRDLIVQQLGGRPAFISALLNAAQERNTPLDSYRHCQQFYVDELMGGRIHRRFSTILVQIAPQASTRRALIRVLYEATMSDGGRSSMDAWRKRLDIDADKFQNLMRELHVHEIVSLNSSMVETGSGSSVWTDYLRTLYRMDILAEPRAQVVAETIVDTLKRAPQTMARHYRRANALGLRELLSFFNCQKVPASLMHYDRFSRVYKGASAEDVSAGLESETELILLPQIIHVASCASFHSPMHLVCDEERCAVGHGFDAAVYTDANEVVWIAAEIESKVEAGRGITEMWCDRLDGVARACGWNRVKLLLVAPEGFSKEASELLTERDAYGASRRQLELLSARLGSESTSIAVQTSDLAPDEFEMVIPMGEETELIAASTIEQIARRSEFKPEAINQIKTALVEACINAMEHSLSPDRKIYQRFRVESDKLTVTISSRGVVPAKFNGQNGESGGLPDEAGTETESSAERRGWGLKLIRTLMDEVEFERVDDGTCLRMTKYLRK